MSFYHGLGMFIFGMGATIPGAIIAYFIINKVMEKKEDPKRFDDLE
jgi:phage shock protein PspC (stress-responsive transcriptional regulator)